MTDIVFDGVGQQFYNTADMCLYYGIPVWMFEIRLQLGYPVQVALTAHCKEYYTLTCCDFRGVGFNSLYAMCDFYRIPVRIFEMRAEAGWDLREILLTPA